MKKFNTLGEVLAFAINLEQMANLFYIDLSKRADTEAMKKILLDLAEEENQHKQRLERIIGIAENVPGDNLDHTEVAKYIAAVPTPDHMTYEDAVRLAMNKEHAAMMLYQILAKFTDDKQLREVLELLAIEEAHHKRRFEKEYHDIKLKKN
ncbi:MAG TPA: ferritin family protein [Anaerohalosphaeraceae bacterium]|nr:ferritin family protein [Anaerohalosphaeraceae bacterium]